MIIRSHMRITRPKVMSRYLLMIAAMISVPPVLPFHEKAVPTPKPQKEAPMTHAIKGWSCSKVISLENCWTIETKVVSVRTP